jgi:hypothetical protein
MFDNRQSAIGVLFLVPLDLLAVATQPIEFPNRTVWGFPLAAGESRMVFVLPTTRTEPLTWSLFAHAFG